MVGMVDFWFASGSALAMRAVIHGIVLDELDRRTQVRLFAALLGLVILGLTGMLMAWLGARATRRYMRRGEPQQDVPAVRRGDDDWARKPLQPPRN